MPCNLFPPVLFQGVPFGDRDALVDFNGHHALWHRALAEATGTPFLLVDDLRINLANNNAMHEAVAVALGLPGPPDLLGYDLSDRAAFQLFMQAEGHDVRRLASALGL